MPVPDLPSGLAETELNRVANSVHSVSLRLLRRVREVDSVTGLSGPRISLLSVLVFAGPKPISRLAGIEQVSGPAVTKLVDGLAQDGLARRVRSETDRRVVMVEATAAGRKRLEQGRARRVEAMADALRDLEAPELLQVRATFEVLARLLG